MTVKELFQAVDFRLIAKDMADSDWDLEIDNTKSEEEKKEIRKDMTEYIYEKSQEMLKIEEEKNPEKIICCIKTIDFDEEEGLNPSLIHRSDLLHKEIPIYDYDHPEKNPSLTETDYEERYIQTYAFEFSPWEEILGSYVADVSIQEYGACEVAKAIFDEMTFFGYEYESRKEKTEKEMKILDESVREIEEHPENCKTVSMEELWAELEADGKWKRPTPEEEEEQRRKSKESMKKTQEEKVKILRKLVEDVEEKYI